MLTVTNLKGQTEILTDYKGLNRERGVNGEKTLSFLVLPTETNEVAFSMVQEESIIEFQNEKYIIKKLGRKSKGGFYYLEVGCVHEFFCYMNDDHIYDVLEDGSRTFLVMTDFIFDGSPYTVEVIGTYYADVWQGFGDDNRLALFQKLLARYGCEFELIGNVVRIKPQIGIQGDFQFRYNHNIKSINEDIDTSSLSTYIKGFGAIDEATGQYIVTAEYTSPNASIFGIRHSKPVRDEKYTTYDGLLERLQAELKDVPDISITIDFIDLRRAGYAYEVPNEGDTIYLIYEPMNIDTTVRIVTINEDFDINGNIISCKVTLANYRNSMTDLVANFNQTEKRLNGLLDSNGKVKNSVLDEYVRRSTESIKSAETELLFENGIQGIDKSNPNNLTLFNSKGFGISKDGGQTFTEAITADGFNLTVGAIGQLKSDNIQIGAGTTFHQGYDPSTKAEANALLNYVDKVTYGNDLEGLQTQISQIDGSVTNWFKDYAPTLTNEPASLWITVEDKTAHLDDLFYDTVTGYVYRFVYDGVSVYSWSEIKDQDIQDAMETASNAADAVDQKRRVFVDTPIPPYDIGDLWVGGTSGDLKRCKTTKAVGEAYSAWDWVLATKYTDDTALNNLKIGGTNIIRHTDFSSFQPDKWTAYNTNTFSPSTFETITLASGETLNFMKVRAKEGLASGAQFGYQTQTDSYSAIVKDKEYTLSFLVAIHPNAKPVLDYIRILNDDYLNQTLSSVPDVSTFKLYGTMTTPSALNVYEFTYTFKSLYTSSQSRFMIGGSNNANFTGTTNYGFFYVAKIKLEEGSKATSYSKSPLDVDSAIINAKNEAMTFATGEADNVKKLWAFEDTTYIDGGKIYTDTVTANHINVSQLSAIAANLGTVTAGTLTGVTVQSVSAVGDSVIMSDGNLRTTKVRPHAETTGWTTEDYTRIGEGELYLSSSDDNATGALQDFKTVNLKGSELYSNSSAGNLFKFRDNKGWQFRGGTTPTIELHGGTNNVKLLEIDGHSAGGSTIHSPTGTLSLGNASYETKLTGKSLSTNFPSSRYGSGLFVEVPSGNTDLKVRAFTSNGSVTIVAGQQYANRFVDIDLGGVRFSELISSQVSLVGTNSVFMTAGIYNLTTAGCNVYVGTSNGANRTSDVTISYNLLIIGYSV